MSSPLEAETDPSVCYRHPDRQSWVLCQRCGRTICPECQILAPVGVQCPECVREAGGSVQWRPTGGSRASSAAGSMRRRPAWVRRLSSMLRPDGDNPLLSWGIAAVAIVLWIGGLFTPFLFDLLVATPARPLEVWRLVTGLVVYPNGIGSIITVALAMVFWLLNAPGAERTMGRPRFATIVVAATVIGNAVSILLGGYGYGIFAALFAIFGAYLVASWDYPPARNQILIMLGILAVIRVVFGGVGSLIELILGVAVGAGAEYLLRWFDNRRARVAPRTPYLIVIGIAVAIAVVAILVRVVVPVVG